uniref:SH3 domain containing ring finger 2 n=1 Tax=Mastacembelus armatus TaxID=205130 RepID=A0A3Q3RYC2_9TELE
MEYRSGRHVVVDYSVSDVPEDLVSKRGGPFKMEELSLMALLECPLCLEQLDVSAKVLPCQHTFCMTCLQRQEAAQSQLFCPECRAPFPDRTVEELPANLLLVQILEGIQGSTGLSSNSNSSNRQTAHYAAPLSRGSLTFREHQESQYKELQGHNEGDILSVIRRVDEHWIEAKLGDKVGICPQQFTEPNSVAAKLLEGRSRGVSDSAEFQHRTGVECKDKASDACPIARYGVPQVPAKTPIVNALRKHRAADSSNFYQGTNISTINSLNHQGQRHRLSVPSPTQVHSHHSRVDSQRVRRHSDSTHRHLLQSEKKMTSETPPTISMALVNPQTSSASAESKHSSTQQLSISVCAVLYSYKPRRPEELELRKGEMVGVYGKFKEGWLRGLSLRTGKVGILPSNYITPVLRTSARLLETKAASASSQHNSTAAVKKPTATKNPAVVVPLDRVTADGTTHSTGQVPSVPNAAQHAMPSTGIGKPSFYGGSQGWDTVRRIFNPHRGSNHFYHSSSLNIPSNSKHFAQVQASGYSPAMQRKKNSSSLSNSGRPPGWMTEPTVPSAAAVLKNRNFAGPHEATLQHDRHPPSGPHSILIRPDSHKNTTDKPAKSVRFLTDEDSPPTRHRTSSWSSGNQVPSNCHPGPPLLEVWAPSLTLGRDGPGIILKEGKAPILRKCLETASTDLNYNSQKPVTSQPSLSAISAQFSPSRYVGFVPLSLKI